MGRALQWLFNRSATSSCQALDWQCTKTELDTKHTTSFFLRRRSWTLAAEISWWHMGSFLKRTMSPTWGTNPCSFQAMVSLLLVYSCCQRSWRGQGHNVTPQDLVLNWYVWVYFVPIAILEPEWFKPSSTTHFANILFLQINGTLIRDQKLQAET